MKKDNLYCIVDVDEKTTSETYTDKCEIILDTGELSKGNEVENLKITPDYIQSIIRRLCTIESNYLQELNSIVKRDNYFQSNNKIYHYVKKILESIANLQLLHSTIAKQLFDLEELTYESYSDKEIICMSIQSIFRIFNNSIANLQSYEIYFINILQLKQYQGNEDEEFDKFVDFFDGTMNISMTHLRTYFSFLTKFEEIYMEYDENDGFNIRQTIMLTISFFKNIFQQISVSCSDEPTQFSNSEDLNFYEDLYQADETYNDNMIDDDKLKKDCRRNKNVEGKIVNKENFRLSMIKIDNEIQNFIENENDYLSSLHYLVKVMDDVRENLKSDKLKIIPIIFQNIQDIQMFHEKLHVDLKQFVIDKKSIIDTSGHNLKNMEKVIKKFCSVFTANWTWFLNYDIYTANHSQWKHKINELVKMRKIRYIIKKHKPKSKISPVVHFLSILRQPIGRLSKYLQIIKNLQNFLSNCLVDYENVHLLKTSHLLKDVTRHIDEYLVDRKNFQESADILSRYTQDPDFIKSFGKLVKKGSVEKSKKNDICLFERCIVLKDVENKSIKIDMENCRFSIVEMKNDDYPFKLYLHIRMKSKERKMKLSFKTEDECLNWYDIFISTKTRTCPTNTTSDKHRFILETLEVGQLCKFCGRLLIGMMTQGYNCSHCSTQLHTNCLNSFLMEGDDLSI
ncbi:hypothetical protein SNEBB_007690 [Seison nebaliae]|nr:hypothetical protein SNEBB_007690 [Seison nebaliae]